MPEQHDPMPQPGEGQPPAQPAAAPPSQAPFPPGSTAAIPPAPPPVVPPRERGGFARGFGLGSGIGLGLGAAAVVLGVVSTVLSMITLVGIAAAGASFANPSQRASNELLTTVWGEDSAKQTLRAIPVRGSIMASSSDGVGLTAATYGYEVADLLDSLKAEDAGGVVLLMNTPGGSINGSRAMADAIVRYRERTGHKVFAYVQGMSASGGMYTMAGADEIVADHGSLVGSVGVIIGPFEYYNGVVATEGGILGGGVTTTGGISSEYITAGRGKDSGNPYRPLTDEERADFQAWVDQEYATFVDQVATKRGIAPTVMTEQVGAALLGTDRALEVGYIDAVMGRPEAFRHFAQEAGLDPNDTRLVQSTGLGFWGSLLGVEARPLGMAPAAQPAEGQAARVTSTLCTSRTPLAWAPETAAGFCG